MLAVLVGCASEPAWDQEDAAAIHARYLNVDLDYFFDAPPDAPTPQHPLYRGLKAKIDGRLDDAERHLGGHGRGARLAAPVRVRPIA
jgi:hypothetical protein